MQRLNNRIKKDVPLSAYEAFKLEFNKKYPGGESSGLGYECVSCGSTMDYFKRYNFQKGEIFFLYGKCRIDPIK